jgi:hypothetical protein
MKIIKPKLWLHLRVISKETSFAELGNVQENVLSISGARQRGMFSRLVIMQWGMFSRLVVRQ